MKTSQRLEAMEQRVKTAFKVADARASLASQHVPPAGHTPASKIANALKTEAIQSEAHQKASAIKSGLDAAMDAARAELLAIEQEAAAARHLSNYVKGTVTDIPVNVPDHLKSAARAVRGQSPAPMVARQLELAASNAEEEVARLKSRWLPRTEWAAKQAAANKALQIFLAAKMDRPARAAALLADRADLMRKKTMELNARRRLGHE